MPKQLNNIDKLIIHSKIDFNVSDDYNSKIIDKIDKLENNRSKNPDFSNAKLRITAISLILSGFITMISAIPQIQSRIINVHYKIESFTILMVDNNNSKIIKHFLGE